MQNAEHRMQKVDRRMRDAPFPRGSQSIKIDIEKLFDKSISIDKLKLKELSQPPPFSMPLKLLILHGAANCKLVVSH